MAQEHEAPSCAEIARAFNARLEAVSRLSQGDVSTVKPRAALQSRHAGASDGFRESLDSFQTRPMGDSIRVSNNGMTVSRSASERWGTQLLGRWFSRGVASIKVLVTQCNSECYVGVVGSNFLPSASHWDAPLNESKHAVVVHTGSGRIICKGVTSPVRLPLPPCHLPQLQSNRWRTGPAPTRSRVDASPRPSRSTGLRSGTVMHFVVDQVNREMTIEILAPDPIGASLANIALVPLHTLFSAHGTIFHCWARGFDCS